MTLGFINCSSIAERKVFVSFLFLLLLISGLLLYIFHARYSIYTAPIKVIMGLIDGMALYKVILNMLDKAIIIVKPEKTPKLKGKLFLNPYLVAFDIDIILFGPGVKVATIT